MVESLRNITLNLLLNVIGDSKNETPLPHKLLTDTQILWLHKAFVNNLSANRKLLKTQLTENQNIALI